MPNSQLNIENCVFNFRCLLAQCYLQVVITSLLFVYQMLIVKCSVWILTIYLKFRGSSTPVAWFYRASLHLDTLYVAIPPRTINVSNIMYLNTYFNFFPTHMTKKNLTEKMDLRRKTIKITSEMELDFGWKTSSRKSRLYLH